ncbi:Aste57867_14270 [Aphanomyces stellatus]|uniref:Aste57867_14270 protein n=1 Tax=Aphanomyces stellatus TaxID=120398 RepID=A0A485L1X6_9STRA|nr:hypothetical protein As57867_014219 [Aphanomyces stellatus]VFT91095.1 Aste57867_14270 [Aphanomyces stellatus]
MVPHAGKTRAQVTASIAMASLLTGCCKNIERKTDTIADLIDELLSLEIELQDGHTLAKEDPDKGEDVLQVYVRFLDRRDALIAELKKEDMPVPWQLRMKVDDFEQSLKERKKRESGDMPTSPKMPSASSKTTDGGDDDDEHYYEDPPADPTTETTFLIGAAPLIVTLVVVAIGVYIKVYQVDH